MCLNCHDKAYLYCGEYGQRHIVCHLFFLHVGTCLIYVICVISIYIRDINWKIRHHQLIIQNILFQFSVKSVKPSGNKKRLRILPISYCVNLIMVTINSHIFINIFQTIHFTAVKCLGVTKKLRAFFWY